MRGSGILRSSRVVDSRKFRALLWAVPYARGRTRLRFGGTVQDLTDSVHHRLRSISLDEMPAALYNTVDTVGREVGQVALEILPYLVQSRSGFRPRGRLQEEDPGREHHHRKIAERVDGP